MIDLKATVDGDQFITTCRGLQTETMEQIAAAFPAVFAGCFVYGGETDAAPVPVKRNRSLHLVPHMSEPRERKVRAAKDATDEDLTDRAEVLLFLRQPGKNGARPADICPDMDKKRKGKALAYHKDAGSLVLQGTAGAARYFLPNGAGQEAEA